MFSAFRVWDIGEYSQINRGEGATVDATFQTVPKRPANETRLTNAWSAETVFTTTCSSGVTAGHLSAANSPDRLAAWVQGVGFGRGREREAKKRGEGERYTGLHKPLDMPVAKHQAILGLVIKSAFRRASCPSGTRQVREDRRTLVRCKLAR